MPPRTPMHSPVERTREPEPRACARRFLHKRSRPAHTQTWASGRESHFCTNESAFLHVRTRAPARSPQKARTNNPRHARTRAIRTAPAGPSERVPEMHVRTQAACGRRPDPPPRTTWPNQPRADAWGACCPRARPNPSDRPHATSRPCRHPSSRLPPQAHPRHPPARPPSLRSGFRPGAAPVPPSASLPEDRYHPVNAPLDRAPLSCDIRRLFILYDVVPAMPPLDPPTRADARRGHHEAAAHLLLGCSDRQRHRPRPPAPVRSAHPPRHLGSTNPGMHAQTPGTGDADAKLHKRILRAHVRTQAGTARASDRRFHRAHVRTRAPGAGCPIRQPARTPEPPRAPPPQGPGAPGGVAGGTLRTAEFTAGCALLRRQRVEILRVP